MLYSVYRWKGAWWGLWPCFHLRLWSKGSTRGGVWSGKMAEASGTIIWIKHHKDGKCNWASTTLKRPYYIPWRSWRTPQIMSRNTLEFRLEQYEWISNLDIRTIDRLVCLIKLCLLHLCHREAINPKQTTQINKPSVAGNLLQTIDQAASSKVYYSLSSLGQKLTGTIE